MKKNNDVIHIDLTKYPTWLIAVVSWCASCGLIGAALAVAGILHAVFG